MFFVVSSSDPARITENRVSGAILKLFQTGVPKRVPRNLTRFDSILLSLCVEVKLSNFSKIRLHFKTKLLSSQPEFAPEPGELEAFL